MATADSDVNPSLFPEPDRQVEAAYLLPYLGLPRPLSDLVIASRQGKLTEAERDSMEAQVTREHEARMTKIRARLTEDELHTALLPVAVQREVRERARQRCEFCLIHEDDTGSAGSNGCMADLVVTEKHGGQAALENLAYLCHTCNRSRGSAATSFANDGTITRLFNPRQDKWDEHFRVEGYLIIPLTPIAEATVYVFDFNAAPRRDERRGLQLLGRYPVEADETM